MKTITGTNTDNKLSTKITMIVFWGLFIIGLGFASLLLNNIKEDTIDRRASIADSIAYRINNINLDHGLVSATTRAELGRIIASQDVIRVDIQQQDKIISFAENTIDSGPSEVISRDLPATTDQTQAYRINITFADLDATIHNERKRLLVILGALLLFFGVLLKSLLEKILNQPMTNMVNTAQAISSGDLKKKFDESRKDEFGYLASFINTAITNMHNQEQAAYRAKEFAEVTLRSIGDGIVTTDKYGKIMFMNPVAEKLTGHKLADVFGKSLIETMPLICETRALAVSHPMATCLKKNEIIEVETDCVLLRKDGSTIAVANSAAPIQGNNKQLLGGIMVFHDVSEARSLQKELSYQASHDHLTGLYNRREFDLELKQALLHAKRDNHQHCLCYMDLDQFKVINDTCGHAAGDMLLQQLSEKLKIGLRKSDVLARLGGDEFALLLLHCDLQQAEKITETILKMVNDFRFDWQGKSCQVGVSIGLVPLLDKFADTADLMAATDMACYAAKEAGRNRIHIYREGDKKLIQRREEMSMVSKVRQAVVENLFELFAQPIVSTKSVKDCKHYEILLRMKDADNQYISPARFLPGAERYQLMADVDRWVVHHSFKLMLEMSERKKDFSLAINLSGQSINDTTFLKFVIDKIAELEVDASRICFEITETTAISNLTHAISFIETLKKHNCKFSLDDFGTGVSSFEYLKRLPVDYLKIDGAFIKQLDNNKVDRAMVKAIHDVAEVLGMKTIAEFVENEAIYKVLDEIGIDYAQGYWIARPELASDIIVEY